MALPNNIEYALVAWVGVAVVWHLPQLIEWYCHWRYGE